MITGSDILHDLQINLLFSKERIQWRSPNNPFAYNSIPMEELGLMSDQESCDIVYDLYITSQMLHIEEERLGKILDVDYSKVDIDDIVYDLDIAKSTKQKLKQTLKKYPTLYGGGLGRSEMRPVEIELIPDTKLYTSKFYKVPIAYGKIAKTEVNCLCTVCTLEKVSQIADSPWAVPSFCQLKKTDDTRLLTVKSLQKIEKINSARVIDISQGYYSILLSKKSKKICTTILPWEKYAYKRLQMGIACAPDIFQSIVMDSLGDLDYVFVYINDILILQPHGKSEEEHLTKMEVVLKQLNDIGFRANLHKLYFMQKEVEYLRLLLTINRLKPHPQKVEQ